MCTSKTEFNKWFVACPIFSVIMKNTHVSHLVRWWTCTQYRLICSPTIKHYIIASLCTRTARHLQCADRNSHYNLEYIFVLAFHMSFRVRRHLTISSANTFTPVQDSSISNFNRTHSLCHLYELHSVIWLHHHVITRLLSTSFCQWNNVPAKSWTSLAAVSTLPTG